MNEAEKQAWDELAAAWRATIEERDKARALVRDVLACGVAFDDARLDYVEVQLDRATYDAMRAQPWAREGA